MPGKLTLTGLMTSPDDVKEQYRDASNLRARAAIYRFAVSNVPWPRWVFDQLDLPANPRVLEIGCGAGGLWNANVDRIPQNWRLTLSDLSPGMLDESRKVLAEIDPIDFVRADVQTLAFADGRFDAVVANHMLYHVPDLPRALQEIRRVLVPGGKLYATTNGEDHLCRMKELIYQFLGDESQISKPLAFSLDNSEALLSAHFSNVELRSTRGELRVTEPDAIVAYVMSVHTAAHRIIGVRYDELVSQAQREVSDQGAFVVNTHAGICIAAK